MFRFIGAFCLLFIAVQGSAQEIIAGVSLDRLERSENYVTRDYGSTS